MDLVPPDVSLCAMWTPARRRPAFLGSAARMTSECASPGRATLTCTFLPTTIGGGAWACVVAASMSVDAVRRQDQAAPTVGEPCAVLNMAFSSWEDCREFEVGSPL